MLSVDDTAQAIDQAAGRLRQAATDLEHLAKQMREKSDLGYAAEALWFWQRSPMK